MISRLNVKTPPAVEHDSVGWHDIYIAKGFISLSSSVFLRGLHRRLLYPVALPYALELVLCGDLSGQL